MGGYVTGMSYTLLHRLGLFCIQHIQQQVEHLLVTDPQGTLGRENESA